MTRNLLVGSDELRFSLRDMFAVIAVIGILLALLIPALTRQRDSGGRRTSCAVNLDQIALAMHNYVTAKSTFPGYRGNRTPDNNYDPRDNIDASWFVAVGPQMEYSTIYERHDQFTVTVPPPSGRHNYPLLELAICPSDHGRPVSHLSYVVNAGRLDLEEGAESIHDSPLESAVAPDSAANGVFHDRSKNKAPRVGLEMRDGASNTLMLSENRQASYWHRVDEPEIAFVFELVDGEPSARYRINGHAAVLKDGEAPRPSSNHPGGVNVTFCDRRSVFLRDDIDYKVYQALMTPDGSHPDCDVPSTDAAGKPIPGSNKAYLLRPQDYGRR
jgi:prepilin-type processing-associated H-X9-DG protein